MDRSKPLKIKLHYSPNPLNIAACELEHTFQVARDSIHELEVVRVLPGSQADACGLEMGDIILRYDSHTIGTLDDLNKAKEREPGEVEMVVLRKGREIEVRLERGPIGVYTRTVFK